MQLIAKNLFFFLLCWVCTSCHQAPKDFMLSYSVESINNYKFVVTFQSDSTYQIEKYNYYMDNFEGKRRPDIQKGRLTAETFQTLEQCLKDADLFSMKDAYGFEKDETRWSTSTDIIYQVNYLADGKEKFVTCKSSAEMPSSFIRFVQFVNTFLSDL